jgi:mono/diheme cytochrome c family protein
MRVVFSPLPTIVLAMTASSAAATEPVLQHELALVNEGRSVYEHACASCHGARGEGAANWQGPDRNGELPAPPHDSEGHTWKHSDAMLYRIVQQGWRDPFNRTERLTMPAFNEQLSPGQIVAVVTYLKTLWTPQQRQFQAEESRGHPSPARQP